MKQRDKELQIYCTLVLYKEVQHQQATVMSRTTFRMKRAYWQSNEMEGLVSKKSGSCISKKTPNHKFRKMQQLPQKFC